MPVTITWLGDKSGLNLHPTWVVDEVRFHTVEAMLQPDGSRKDTFVMYASASPDQLGKLVQDYGKHSLNLGILGLLVIPLYPNAVLWTWKAPLGYENRIKDGTYTAFTVKEE